MADAERVAGPGAVPEGFAGEIGERIFGAREERYEREVTADRFDGNGNFDHSEGKEVALRSLAGHYGVRVPDEEETKAEGIRRLRARIAEHWGDEPVDPDGTDSAVLEYLECVEAGITLG